MKKILSAMCPSERTENPNAINGSHKVKNGQNGLNGQNSRSTQQLTLYVILTVNGTLLPY